MRSWVVLLEAAPEPDGEPMEAASLRRVLEEMGGHGVGLHAPDRVAVQLELDATNQAEALYAALSRWERAVTPLELGGWQLVRTEVLTPDELEAEFDGQGVGATLASLCVGDGGCGDDDEVMAQELLDRLFKDPLTGLEGADAFASRVRRALRSRRRTGSDHWVLAVGVDGFAAIARALGHGTADQVLVVLAHRLAGALRTTEPPARVGPAEFAVLLEGVPLDAALSIADRLLGVVQVPLVVRADDVRLTASIGLTPLLPTDEPEGVLQRARDAMANVTASGGGKSALSSGGDRAGGFELPRPPAGPAWDHDPLSALRLLQETAAVAQQGRTVEEAGRRMLREVCAQTGWPVAHIWLVSPDGPRGLASSGIWHLPSRYELFKHVTETGAVAAECTLPRRVLLEREAAWIVDVTSDPSFRRRDSALGTGLRSGFALPVFVGDEVGAVAEFFTTEPRLRDGYLLELLGTVALHLGLVLERARAAEALQRSEERLRECLGSTADAVTTVDQPGLTIRC